MREVGSAAAGMVVLAWVVLKMAVRHMKGQEAVEPMSVFGELGGREEPQRAS